jgi:adenylate cyclase class IV
MRLACSCKLPTNRLGTFLEFEAVLGPGVDDALGRAQVAELMARFGLSPSDLISGSYADTVL